MTTRATRKNIKPNAVPDKAEEPFFVVSNKTSDVHFFKAEKQDGITPSLPVSENEMDSTVEVAQNDIIHLPVSGTLDEPVRNVIEISPDQINQLNVQPTVDIPLVGIPPVADVGAKVNEGGENLSMPSDTPVLEEVVSEEVVVMNTPAIGVATNGLDDGSEIPPVDPALAESMGLEPLKPYVPLEVLPTTPRDPAEDPNFVQLESKSEDLAKDQKKHTPAAKGAEKAQAASPVAGNERKGGAQTKQVDKMNEQEPKPFDAAQFKDLLLKKILDILPKDEESAEAFPKSGKMQEVGKTASEKVQSEKENSGGAIQETSQQEPDPNTVPARDVIPLQPDKAGSRPGSLQASSAMPPERGDQEVNAPLDDNIRQVDEQVNSIGVAEEELENSGEPSIQATMDQRRAAKEDAKNAPVAFRNEENVTLLQAREAAEKGSDAQIRAIHDHRSAAMTKAAATQNETATKDSAERARVSTEINAIFESTQTDVNTILSSLDSSVNTIFESGNRAATLRFEIFVAEEMRKYKDKRYGAWYDIGGQLKRVKDAFVGLPPEVNKFYEDGRNVFLQSMDVTLSAIAVLVATKLNEAKARIAKGKIDVEAYVTALPKNLKEFGKQTASGLESKFESLSKSVDAKQGELIDSVAKKYSESLQKVDERIEAMKAANRGIIDFVMDGLKALWNAIVDFKNKLLSLLASALDAIAYIVMHPIEFLGLLFDGISLGFDNFVANLWTHLTTGFIQWLTGAMGGTITIPDDIFSLQGIFSLAGQILGISWDFVRKKAVRLLGEPVVSVIEGSLELFVIIKRDGISGLWEFIKDQFNNLKEMVMDAIFEMLTVEVIEAGVTWLLSLLNPVSALFKAIKMIIDVVKFFIQRAAQIMALVEAFIQGVKAVVSGNVAAVAIAIENAMARAIPVIIGFLAALLGLGDIAAKVQKIVEGIRDRVDKAVDWVIDGIKTMAKQLFNSITGKAAEGQQQTNEEELSPNELEDTVVGQTLTFSDGHESHQLWVEDTAGGVEVMVRSTKMTVSQKLDEWSGKIDTLPEDKRDDARSLISAARGQSQQVKVEGNQAKLELDKAESTNDATQDNRAAQADQEVEDAEVDLKITLKSLFEIFGEEVVNFTDLRFGFLDENDIEYLLQFDQSEEHRILLEKGKKSKVYEMVLNALVSNGTPEFDSAKSEALQKAAQIDKKIRQTSLDEDQKMKELNELLQSLGEITKKLFGANRPKWNEPEYGSMQNGLGTAMRIVPLTNVSMPRGSKPSEENNIFTSLNERRYSTGSPLYIKGHLLNENLGGPGEWKNMTPLTKDGNGAHLNQMEKFVKAATFSGAVLEYSVAPKYGPRSDKASLLTELENIHGVNSPKTQALYEIVNAEDYVPFSLVCKAYYLEIEPPHERNRSLSLANIEVPLDRSAESYHVFGVPDSIINLANLQPGELMQLPDSGINESIDSKLTKKIYEQFELYEISTLEQLVSLLDSSEIGFDVRKLLEFKNILKLN